MKSEIFIARDNRESSPDFLIEYGQGSLGSHGDATIKSLVQRLCAPGKNLFPDFERV